MADITMRLDDTLELDAIIQEWSSPENYITINPDDDVGSDSHNLDGLQTNTGIFDPKEPGGYTIKINGQELYINVKDTRTAPDDYIEDFEDNSTDDYSVWDSGYSIVSDKVKEGTYSLYRGGSTSTFPQSYPDDGFVAYPEQGSHFRFWGNSESKDSNYGFRIGFGVQDSNNFFAAYCQTGGNNPKRIELQKWENGSKSVLKNTGVNVSTGNWYKADIYWYESGDIKFELRDTSGDLIDSIEYNDSTYESGGIAWILPTGGRVDALEIVEYI